MPDFDSLYALWYPQLYGYLAKRVGQQNADDIAQDTLVKLWQRGDVPEQLKSWLFRVAKNAACDLLRYEQVRARYGHLGSFEALQIEVTERKDPIGAVLAQDAAARFLATAHPSHRATFAEIVRGGRPDKMAVCHMRKAYHALEGAPV